MGDQVKIGRRAIVARTLHNEKDYKEIQRLRKSETTPTYIVVKLITFACPIINITVVRHCCTNMIADIDGDH